MTLNEIAYNLLNLVRGGRSNHDEHISLDQIKFNIKHYRAMFIRRDYAKNGFVSRHVEQDLGCVQLKSVDASKCCNLNTSCAVYRTIKEVPKTIRYNFEEAISYVGDISGTGTIPMVNSNTIQCEGGGCYDDSSSAFPIPMDMLSLINQGILAGELQLLSGSFSDTENDRMQDPKTVRGTAPQK